MDREGQRPMVPLYFELSALLVPHAGRAISFFGVGARSREAGITPEQRERKRERDREWHRERYANDPEFLKRKLERQRVAGMTPEQGERKRERQRERKRERYANDPEFRERFKKQERKRKRQQRALHHVDQAASGGR